MSELMAKPSTASFKFDYLKHGKVPATQFTPFKCIYLILMK